MPGADAGSSILEQALASLAERTRLVDKAISDAAGHSLTPQLAFPFAICAVEKTAFNSTYFLTLLEERLMGPGGSMSQHDQAQDFAAALIPHHFFSNPGLWIGLVVAAAFLAIAVRLRRDRGPI